ncbi:hypothetical protein JD844_019780 [Phrynosoma platyrhinos]|uniref:Vitellogenin domain-containing protein n=1 Tax=Phrynosoma platyrhinos TaxID=52577 RepID=A0ABQ7TR40_PHRPL|nr:hypothetical protein JD844_019780 [Phrynosoma platyrhinos]
MSPCAGSSALTLPPGSRFSYRYSTSTNTFLQGKSSKQSSVTLESTAVIEVLSKCHSVLKLQDVQIKMILESREKMLKENSSLREALEQHRLLFCFHNGKIQKIFPQEKEPTWVLNIKRGILSAFQTSWVAAAANSRIEEVCCPAQYTMDTKDIYESTLLYEKEKVVALSKEEEEKVVVSILQELCVKPNVDSESAADHFMTLVFDLRRLSASALMSLWQRSSSKCQRKW